MESMEIEPTQVPSCYPKDYAQGKKYGRDVLSKVFSCMAGPDKFPVDGVKEWMFPLLPTDKGHVDPTHSLDSMNIYGEPMTMQQVVDKEKSRHSSIKLLDISITPDMIHPETLAFMENKRNAVGYAKRVGFQKEKATKEGQESLTKNEPFVFELKSGKYFLSEGWHRFMALLELFEEGKIKSIKGKSWVLYPA